MEHLISLTANLKLVSLSLCVSSLMGICGGDCVCGGWNCYMDTDTLVLRGIGGYNAAQCTHTDR